MIAKTLVWVAFLQGSALMLPAQPDLSAVDAYARSLPFCGEKNLLCITDSLTNPFTTDLEKGRAIFIWITEFIEYDCASLNRPEAEPESALHPLYYTWQQSQLILRTRRTRCDGFAFMFTTMCRLAGIYATTLEGYARFAGRKIDPATVQPNHAWNAACFDGEWYESDATAAAGQCENGKFLRIYGSEFFRMNDQLLERLYIPINDSRNSTNSGRIILKF